MAITSFTAGYRFLSNFWPSPIDSGDGLLFPTVEHAYQYTKFHGNEKVQEKILHATTPQEAKRLGRSKVMRKDWEDIKVDVMETFVWLKFQNHPDLAQMLLATGDQELVEGNWWGDTFWGTCNGVGKNYLGKILMDVRKTLKEGALLR